MIKYIIDFRRLCIVFIIVLSLASCATVDGKRYEAITNIPNNMCLFYIYRPWNYFGSALYYPIIVSDIRKSVGNGGYIPFLLPPGDTRIELPSMGFPPQSDSLNVYAEDGKTYYIKLLPSYKLEITDEQSAQEEIKKCSIIEDVVYKRGQEEKQNLELAKIEKKVTKTDNKVDIKEINKETQVINHKNKPLITVFDFKSENISKSDSILIVDLITSSLISTNKYRVIERSQRKKILEEINFSLSGCVDDSCQIEIGKMLSAEYIITGSIGKVGNKFVLNLRVLDVETGESISTSYKIYNSIDLLVEDCDLLVRNLNF